MRIKLKIDELEEEISKNITKDFELKDFAFPYTINIRLKFRTPRARTLVLNKLENLFKELANYETDRIASNWIFSRP